MGTPYDQAQMNLYPNGVGINNIYTMMSGVAVLPIAGNPPEDPALLADWSPVVVLKLHAEYRVRKVSRSATKQNTPPVMATPQDVGKFVFLGGSMVFSNAINTSMYQSDWTVDSETIYVENCVSRPQDGFVLGTPPFLYQAAADAKSDYSGGTPPTVGAVASAGAMAQAGYKEAEDTMVPYSPSGGVPPSIPATVAYANPTFYPGMLLNDVIDNGTI